MERKGFQQTVLNTFEAYLEQLTRTRLRSLKIEEANRGETDADLIRPIPDWPAEAWLQLESDGLIPVRTDSNNNRVEFISRNCAPGLLVPNCSLKIPTGGGKTMLGAECAGRLLNNYLRKNTGLVVWIVPNEAIYSQTLITFKDRSHPYRQILDRAAAGGENVRILEKHSPLSRLETNSNLCVMLLMLQAARAKDKETRRFFRDRGDVIGFLPPMDDLPAQEALIASTPNLDLVEDLFDENTIGYKGRVARNSLGNALCISRPVVVMDEGHYIYTPLAMQTIYDLNPSFLLELSATPNPASNVLVDVPGAALEAEDMIKLPINVTVDEADRDWRNCLRRAWEETKKLQDDCNRLLADTGRYIRPILLVQAERTGKDQRDSGLIHAKDVREFLQSLGVGEEEIAEKTAETDELKKFPYAVLRKPDCPIRVIITKQALQEGWDCPFAYTLCSLASAQNQRAITQLVGRILRQPETKKTGISRLDECYVFCHHTTTAEVVENIRDGLQKEGMGDLAGRIAYRESSSKAKGKDYLERKTRFAQLKVYFPIVLWKDGDTRELDYERDVLSNLDWLSVQMSELAVEATEIRQTRFLRLGLEVLKGTPDRGTVVSEALTFDPAYMTRAVHDILPNPWIARKLIGVLADDLRRLGWDETQLAKNSSDLLSALRAWLLKQQESMAETFFRQALSEGRIEFRLRTDKHSWQLPKQLVVSLPDDRRVFVRTDGAPVDRNVFPVFEHDLNSLELKVARYLDDAEAVSWWHRNVARGQGYGLQGWRKNRVYPDILFALRHQSGVSKLVALETKGDQLAGNLDTKYKEELLKTLSGGFTFSTAQKAGELEIEFGHGTSVVCELVLESDWMTKVPALLKE